MTFVFSGFSFILHLAHHLAVGSDTLTFGPKTCFILVSLCRIAKSSGVSPIKIQPFEDCLILKTLKLGWYCLSSLIICIGVLNFGSIPMAISGALFLYDVGGMVGWLAGGREGDPEAFLFLLAGV